VLAHCQVAGCRLGCTGRCLQWERLDKKPLPSIQNWRAFDVLQTQDSLRLDEDRAATKPFSWSVKSSGNERFPRASAVSLANIETLVTIGIFSGVGLLLSISVLILDKYTPGEWFWKPSL
jgi:hypothetical protein